MKKKILIISIVSVICIVIIAVYFISNNRISQMQVSDDSSLEFENDLLSMEVNENTEDIEDSLNNVVEEEQNVEESILEENVQVEEKETSTQPQTAQVNSSSKATSKVENKKAETKSEVVKETSTTKEETPTKVDIPSTTVSEPKQATKVVETPTRCTNNNNHGMNVGNSGKWFNSKQEAVNYYDSLIKTWGDKWENFEIDSETYDKNCPYGYEVWTCQFCGKWTINFYYR